jgi:hypothetical protein
MIKMENTSKNSKKKRIEYTSHLKLKMKIREIPSNLPKTIYKGAKEKYLDTETSYHIATKKVMYKNKMRDMIVVFEELNDVIRIITIHPIKIYQKEVRIKTGRWKKL